MNEIPNIIHFIYPVTDKTRPWSIVNSLAIKTAVDVYKDHEIIIWTNKPDQVPFVDDYYKRIKVCCVDLPTHVGEAEIVWPQYVSDVMRLQILYEYGGIYMDTDMISLREFKPYDETILSFCWETEFCESICNAYMATPPGNEFIKAWLDRMPTALSNPTWAFGGVVVPYEMTNDPAFDTHYNALSHRFFCPFDLSKNWMFDPKLKAEAKETMGSPFSIHIFETFWRDIVKDITPQWIEENDCLFSELIKAR